MPNFNFEYEFLPMHDKRPIEVDPERLLHPDETIAARATTELRQTAPRRFAFYELVDNPNENWQYLSRSFFGLEFSDKSVLLTRSSKPHGMYNSIASAWRHVHPSSRELWLVWLEPETVDFQPTATAESRPGKLSTCYLSLPYSAFGRDDARMRAANIVAYLKSSVPGLDPLDVTYGLADHPDMESHVYCDDPGCVRPPGHGGNHRYSREAEAPPLVPLVDTAAGTSEPVDPDADADSQPPTDTEPR